MTARGTLTVRVLVVLMLVLAGARAEAQVTARPVLYELESGSSLTRFDTVIDIRSRPVPAADTTVTN